MCGRRHCPLTSVAPAFASSALATDAHVIVLAWVCVCVTDDPFRGMRMVRNQEAVVFRGELRRDAESAIHATNVLIRWVRNVWRRRKRWQRNAQVAIWKRNAASAIQRVAIGYLDRCEIVWHNSLGCAPHA